MAIKINVGGRASVFTKMRLYRSLDIATVYQEANFLKEVAAADTIVDDSTTRQSNAAVFYYGIRFTAEDGTKHDTSPHIVRNVYDTGITWHPDLDNPFISGNAKYGVIRMDDAIDVKIPTTAEIVAFIRKLYPDISFIDNAAAAKRICIAMDGSVYFLGTPWLSIIESYTAQLGFLNRMKPLMTGPDSDSNTLIKNGEKWRLTFLSYDKYSQLGYFINSATSLGDNFPITPQGTTIVSNTTMPDLESDSTFYYLNGTSSAILNMVKRAAGTSVTTQYFGFVMKFVGKV